MKKLLVISALAVLLMVSGYVNVKSSYANENGFTSLVERIAQRFGLDQAEVQQVFDEHREERHEQMQARFEERLDQAVADGRITAEQKQAIMEKHQEMYEKKLQLRGLSPEERRAQMQQYRQELRAWAEENDIDLKAFMFRHGRAFGKGFKMGFSMGSQ